MRLIVGLGNPGSEYRETPHNVGFMAIDNVGDMVAAGTWQSKHNGLLLKGSLNGVSFLLLKPQTYMNISGESVVACQRFYKVELDDILVVSDDIDRPAGALRYRISGGHGGHNGLRSIIQSLGSNQFHRLRIGIGRPSNAKQSISKYVLSKPDADVWNQIDEGVRESRKYIIDFIEGKPVQISPSQPANG